MADLSARAVAVVAAERARDARVIELARLLSLASQVEPELVRAMRLELMPTADAGVESDLWFSPLVQARDPDGISFLPDVAEALRRELAAKVDEPTRRAAWKVVSSLHVAHSPMLVLEETATYYGVESATGGYALMERELGRAVAAVEASSDEVLARWVARTLPRMSEIVRTSDPALALARKAGRRLGGLKIRGVMEAGAPDAEWHPDFLQLLPRMAVGVQLTARGVELSQPPSAPNGLAVNVPHTDPLALEIAVASSTGWHAQHVTWQPGTAAVADVAIGPALRITTIAGDVHSMRVDTLGRAPVLYAPGAGSLIATVVDQADDLGWAIVTTIDQLQFGADGLPLIDGLVLGPGTTSGDVVDAQRRLDILRLVGGAYVMQPHGLQRTTLYDREENPLNQAPLVAQADLLLTRLFQRVGRAAPSIDADRLRGSLRAALIELDAERARHWIARATAAPAPHAEAAFVDSPYPGMRPFVVDEAPIFFGRAREVDAMLNTLDETRFLAVVGPAESGKTSIVNAGLIPALQARALSSGGSWLIASMQPGQAPLRNLAHALARSLIERSPSAEESLAADLLKSFESGPDGIAAVVRRLALPARTNLLVVVDQLEEVFRFREVGQRRESERFIDLLLHGGVSGVTSYVIVILRSDFYAEAQRFGSLASALSASQFSLPPIGSLRDIVVNPARVAGGNVEPEVVARIEYEHSDRPVTPLVLQHALARMWSAARQRSPDAPLITMEDYASAGGIRRALDLHAEEVFAGLSSADQRIAEQMFRLLTEDDVRSPATVAEVAAAAGEPPDRVAAVAEVFSRRGRGFIMPPADRGLAADSLLDLSSPQLIREWQRLREWIRRESESATFYRNLLRQAQLWREGREDVVWTPADIRRAREWRETERPTAAWAARYGGGFDTAMQFLEATGRTTSKGTQPASRQYDFVYYVSYARADFDETLQRFLDLLRSEVRSRTGDEPDQVAFFDTTAITAGDRWTDTLTAGLQRSAVLVSVVSPTYVRNRQTGREVEYFSQLRGQLAGNFVPIVWIPVPALPAVLADIQLYGPEMPERYRREGARGLLRGRNTRDLQGTVSALTESIVRAADGVRGRPPTIEHVPDVDTVGSAWDRTPPRGPNVAHFIVAAGAEKEMTTLRSSIGAYGQGGTDWKPFFPGNTASVAIVVQKAATEAGLLSDVTALQPDWAERLQAAGEANEIAVMVVDSWSLMLQKQRELLRAVDQRNDPNLVTIVVLNEADDEAARMRETLENQLRQTFKHQSAQATPTQFIRVQSSEEFSQRVLESLHDARRRILADTFVKPINLPNTPGSNRLS